MIDAHVQYNSGWKNYMTFQPNLACEYVDHRTCKELSAKLEAEREALSKAVRDDIDAKLKKQVDEAAVFHMEKEAQDELNSAGQKKSEAIRTVNKKSHEALTKINDMTGAKLAKVKAKFDADIQALQATLSIETGVINDSRREALAAIDATDWLAAVRAENAE